VSKKTVIGRTYHHQFRRWWKSSRHIFLDNCLGFDIIIPKMKNKLPTQMETLKSIRKLFAPAVRVERPERGGGYRRPQGNWKKFLDKD
jgi:hypothetical protein